MRRWTTTSQFIRDLLQGAKDAGVDTQAKLQEVNIDPEALRGKTITLTQHQLQNLVFHLASELNDINLGLLKNPLSPKVLKLGYYCAISAETVSNAIAIFCEFFNSYDNSLCYQLKNKSGRGHFEIQPSKDSGMVNTYPLVYWSSIIYRMLCHMSGQRLNLKSANFNHAKPDYVSEYDFMFYDSRIKFNAEKTELVFPQDTMSAPIVNRIKWDNDMFSAELIISQFIAPQSLGAHLEAWLSRKLSLTHQMPSIEETSRHFAMTRQTMLRRLAKENTHFQDIKNQVWKEAACHLLEESNKPISSIALLLGFSEAAAFSRAFKRWTKQTPKEYRNSKA